MPDKYLVLSKNKYLYPKNSVKLYLNLSCFHGELSNKIISEDFYIKNFVKPNIFYTDIEGDKKVEETEKLFNSLSNSLFAFLNNFHGTNYSKRYWEIIYGNWLKVFINTISERYYNIKFALEKYQFDKIIISNEKFININNTLSDFDDNTGDDKWNFDLYSSIIREIFKDKEKLIFKTLKKNQMKKWEAKYSLKDKLVLSIKRVINLFGIFFPKKNNSLISDVNLNFFSLLKLNYFLKQFPTFYFRKKINFISYNETLRNNYNFDHDKYVGIEKFIRKILPTCLPTTIIENYKNIKNITQKLDWPTNPEFIYTGTEFRENELFKFWTAEKTDKNFLYFVVQHGNNYATLKDCHLMNEVKTCDKFISWGKSGGNKYVPLFNTLNLNYKKKIKNKNKIYFFMRHYPFKKILSWDDEYEVFKSYYQTNISIKFLKDDIRKKIIIRINMNYLKGKKDFFLNFFENKENLKIDFLRHHKNQAFNNSQLIVHCYDSTAFLETMSLGIPSVSLLSNEHKFLKAEARGVYSDLLKNKIIFTDPKLMAQHINQVISGNIYEWWDRKDVVRTRQLFLEKYSIPVKNNPEKYLAETLKKLVFKNSK